MNVKTKTFSGDLLGSYRPDGLTSIISYGTGAAFSHMLEFLWFDDGLYVVESTAPVIKRTPWRELIQERYDLAFSLVYMPLNE